MSLKSFLSIILSLGIIFMVTSGEAEVHTSTSGLRYEVKKASENQTSAAAGKHVSVHYTGWLNDGKDQTGSKFDSSVDRGEPFSFNLGAGQVIRGWDEGVAGMKIGEQRRLYIPSALGYGARGAGGVIPPNADLIFDVELLGVQ